MKSTVKFVIYSALIFGLVECGNYTDCVEKLSVLERALYETADNELQLNRAFFPAREQTSRYVFVNYTFLKNSSSDIDCTVTFLWSIGGFLLIQPPKIFQFTSLLVNTPSSNMNRIHITLPYDCRGLVLNSNSSENCSCHNNESSDVEATLEILSKQINQYAKFTNADQVVRDEFSTAQAVCDDDLNLQFDNSEVHLFFGIAVAFPFFSLLLVIVVVRSYHEEIQGKLIAPSNHDNLAGIALTSLYVMAYVFGIDVAAVVHYHTSNHEYKDYEVETNFSLWVVYFPLLFDVICGVVITLVVLLYVMITLVIEVQQSVDHRLRQDKLMPNFEEQENGFDFQCRVKMWLQNETQQRRSTLQTMKSDEVPPNQKLHDLLQRQQNLQEQVTVINDWHNLDKQLRQRRQREYDEFYTQVEGVCKEQKGELQHLMRKQLRLHQCEQLINKQLDILKQIEVEQFQVEVQRLMESEKTCFFLRQDELQTLKAKERDIKSRKGTIQDLKRLTREHNYIELMNDEDYSLDQPLDEVVREIQRKEGSLSAEFTSIYDGQALSDSRKNTLIQKLTREQRKVHKDISSLIMQCQLAQQDLEVLDQLMKQQLDLIRDWEEYENQAEILKIEVVQYIEYQQTKVKYEFLLTDPNQWLSYLEEDSTKEIKLLKNIAVKVKETHCIKQKLLQSEICLWQESEEFLRSHKRDLQINGILNKYIKCLKLFPMVFNIPGYHNKLSIAKHLNLWFISSLIYGLVFVLASHIGYILIAWLTQPERTISAALWGISMFLFLFLIFRALYGGGKDFKGFIFYDSSNKDNYFLALLSVVFIPMTFPFVSCFKKVDKHKEDSFREGSLNMSIRNFSVVGFLVAGVWGLVFVAILTALTVAFMITVVPVPTFSSTEYLQNLVQIVFFVFATLVSYKVFVVHQSELYRFFRSFNRNYVRGSEKRGKLSDYHNVDVESGLNENEFETAGSIAASVAVHLAP